MTKQDPPFTIRLGYEITQQLNNMGPGKNEFVRQAISHALNKICPTCNGTGFVKSSKGRKS